MLLPKDYVRLWLTGDYASDMSDSAGTSWLDVGKRDWSDELLAATGLDREPDADALSRAPSRPASCAPSSRRAGAWQASRWSPAARGDNAALGLRRRRGRAGRGLRVARHVGRAVRLQRALLARTPASAVHAFCHALPDTWHQMGVILSAAGVARMAGAACSGADAAELDRAAVADAPTARSR